VDVHRRLLPYARAYLWVCTGLGLVATLLVLAQAALLASGIAGTVATRRPPPVALLVGLAVVTLARAGLAWAQEVAAHRATARLRGELRADVLAASARPGSPASTGELVYLLTRGLDGLDAYVSRYLPQVVLAGLVPLVVLAAVFPADPLAAVLMLVTVPLIPLFLALVGWTTREHHARQHAVLARLNAHILELIRGLPTLKALGRARDQLARLRRLGDQQHRVTMRTLRLAFVSALVLELLATIAVAVVAVAVGLRLVGGSLDLRTALFVLVLAPEVYLPLRQLGVAHHAAADGLAAAEAAFEVLDRPVRPRGVRRPARPAPLALHEVTVAFPDRATPALTGLSLRVEPGEVVALAGPSGAGKSTVLGLLLGLVSPDAGRVTVGGVDLSDVDIDWWHRQVAWVPQRAVLFPGTVADNIRLGLPPADPARTPTGGLPGRPAHGRVGGPAHNRTGGGTGGAEREAAAVAAVAAATGLASLVDARVDGGLSTGQRQRVALARALLRDAPVVLLDEPTANLDGAAEVDLLAAIDRLAAGRTLIIAAHRPALLARADRVIHLPLPPPPATAASAPTSPRASAPAQPETPAASAGSLAPEPA
jgi:thiol reductant ABC exporter CydD subunit